MSLLLLFNQNLTTEVAVEPAPVTFRGGEAVLRYEPAQRDHQWMPDEVYILGWALGMWQLGAFYGGRVGASIGLIVGWLYAQIKLYMRD